MPTPPKQHVTRDSDWSGRFLTVDDVWSMSNAQFRAAVTLDRLADEDGRVAFKPERIAQIAGVSKPRVSEAAGILANRGVLERHTPGTSEPGYRLTRAARSACTQETA